jgi:hypothetical protein
MHRLDDIARHLRRAHVPAMPCPWLPALSIFDAEDYENYDYGIIGPRDRQKIARCLQEEGFRQRRGRILEGDGLVLEFPPPTRLVSSDPAVELERVLERGKNVPFATPTQVILATLRRAARRLERPPEEELLTLVEQQPANLAKVLGWLRADFPEEPWREILAPLARAQRQGTEARRRRRSSPQEAP